jgi:nicotinamidase/pyrazinamidase
MKTVFFDIDTQFDFLYPGGALYVPGAEGIIATVAALNRYAAQHGIPVVSTTDAHLEDDPEFRQWPPHCVAGTFGQSKTPETLLERRVVVPNSSDAGSAAGLEHAQQIILEKRSVDVFAARNVGRVLDALHAEEYVVYGVVTEICVLTACRGLLRTGKPVTVVTDAVKELTTQGSAAALEEIRSAGGRLAAAEILQRESQQHPDL